MQRCLERSFGWLEPIVSRLYVDGATLPSDVCDWGRNGKTLDKHEEGQRQNCTQRDTWSSNSEEKW